MTNLCCKDLIELGLLVAREKHALTWRRSGEIAREILVPPPPGLEPSINEADCAANGPSMRIAIGPTPVRPLKIISRSVE
jgi:hypothetical protein